MKHRRAAWNLRPPRTYRGVTTRNEIRVLHAVIKRSGWFVTPCRCINSFSSSTSISPLHRIPSLCHHYPRRHAIGQPDTPRSDFLCSWRIKREICEFVPWNSDNSRRGIVETEGVGGKGRSSRSLIHRNARFVERFTSYRKLCLAKRVRCYAKLRPRELLPNTLVAAAGYVENHPHALPLSARGINRYLFQGLTTPVKKTGKEDRYAPCECIPATNLLPGSRGTRERVVFIRPPSV